MLVHITLLLDHRYNGDEKKERGADYQLPPFYRGIMVPAAVLR